MKASSRFSLLFSIAVCLPVAAQSPLRLVPRPDYGIAANTAVSISAFDFVPASSASPYTEDGFGRRYFTAAGGNKFWWAPVHVPSGVTITGLSISYCDSDGTPGNDYVINLVDITGAGSDDFIGSQAAPTNGGCGTVFAALSHDFDANAGHYLALNIQQPDVTDGSLKLIGAAVWYKLRVKDAPVSATFSDVPVGSNQFKFVEALAAAGITGGCGNGKYCPNDPVTRGQMAVFLSVALGLHFPN